MLDAGPVLQSATAVDDAAEVRAEQQNRLGVLRDDMRLAGIRARAADADAADMRLVSQGLTNAIEPLDGIFRPVWGLHRPAVWIGRAAVRSNIRLTGHEGDCAGAVRAVNTVIADLNDEASRLDSVASGHWQDFNGAKFQVNDLLFDLG